MTLIAEDLLLLLLDDERGTLAASASLQPALGGALLVELALAGAVEVEEKRGFWHSAKVRATADPTVVGDPVLRAALGTVAAKERTAQDLVNRLGKGAKDELLASLERRGMVEQRRDRVLGLIPRTTWPAADSTHEDAVRRALTAVLVSGAEPDERTRALVALLEALGRAHRSVDHRGMSSGEVRRRAKALAKETADGDWAAKAVKDAIAASTAATTAAVAAGGAAAAGSG